MRHDYTEDTQHTCLLVAVNAVASTAAAAPAAMPRGRAADPRRHHQPPLLSLVLECLLRCVLIACRHWGKQMHISKFASQCLTSIDTGALPILRRKVLQACVTNMPQAHLLEMASGGAPSSGKLGENGRPPDPTRPKECVELPPSDVADSDACFAPAHSPEQVCHSLCCGSAQRLRGDAGVTCQACRAVMLTRRRGWGCVAPEVVNRQHAHTRWACRRTRDPRLKGLARAASTGSAAAGSSSAGSGLKGEVHCGSATGELPEDTEAAVGDVTGGGADLHRSHRNSDACS